MTVLASGSFLDTLIMCSDFNPKAFTVDLCDYYDVYNGGINFNDLSEDDMVDLSVTLSNMSLNTVNDNDSFTARQGITIVPEHHYTKDYEKGRFKGTLLDVTPLNCFKLLFDDEVEQLFLDNMNQRQLRVDNMLSNEGTRGRPLLPVTSSNRIGNKLKYSARWEQSFNHKDLNKFLSCFFAMSRAEKGNLQDLLQVLRYEGWKKEEEFL